MIPVVTARVVGALVLLAALVALASGCQSTQAESAERELLGEQIINSEKVTNKIRVESKDIEVVDTTLLEDEAGTAVVVEVENKSDETFVNVPILIEVVDKKGKTVFANDLAGLAVPLVSIPVVEAGATVDWVHNQVLPTGEPDDVKVKVGVPVTETPPTIPEIKVDEPKLEKDLSGLEAVGFAENLSAVEQLDITFFAVARKGDEVVAAGRGALKRLLPEAPRPSDYHIFFIGDPTGADISVTGPPSVLTKELE